MSCKKSGACRIRRIKFSVGDLVRWGLIPCRVVGTCGDSVYVVSISRHGTPYGEVLLAPSNELFSYHVGEWVTFRLNGDFVRGRVKGYDSFGRCIVRLGDSFFKENPIRVYHLSSAELLEVA